MRRTTLAAASLSLLMAGMPSRANTFSNDVTDLWWNPNESGWGVNLIQQANVVFATFFIYDSGGQPHWYVASDMRAASVPSDRPYVFSGALYETSGPAFSAASFNPGAVTHRQVGTVIFEFVAPATGRLDYTIDGVAVSKQVTRQTWRANDMSGKYAAWYVTQKVFSAPSGCNPAAGVQAFDDVTISQSDTAFTMTASRTAAPIERCDFTGTYTQAGHMGAVDGAFSCTAGGNGSFTLRELEVGVNGFDGRFGLHDRGCSSYGNFAAVRSN